MVINIIGLNTVLNEFIMVFIGYFIDIIIKFIRDLIMVIKSFEDLINMKIKLILILMIINR